MCLHGHKRVAKNLGVCPAFVLRRLKFKSAVAARLTPNVSRVPFGLLFAKPLPGSAQFKAPTPATPQRRPAVRTWFPSSQCMQLLHLLLKNRATLTLPHQNKHLRYCLPSGLGSFASFTLAKRIQIWRLRCPRTWTALRWPHYVVSLTCLRASSLSKVSQPELNTVINRQL